VEEARRPFVHGTLAKWCVCFVHGTLAKWRICLCAVLKAGFGGRGAQYSVWLVEGCSIGTKLNPGFGGRGALY
jgi:hypothetical protein